jgi:hypothetical protein
LAGTDAEKATLGQYTREFYAFNFMPSLDIHVTTIPTSIGCVGQIKATLTAALGPSKLITTEKEMTRPEINIWQDTSWVEVVPFDKFSDEVIRKTDELIKGFVDAWTASQTPD